jgi:HEAT repeat protein
MPVEQSAALADFARACKAAVRAVSLYPGTHPAIRAALARVSSTSARLTAAGEVSLAIHPDVLAMDGCAPLRPDPAIAELASLLHERLVGELRIEPGADADDWLALLLLLGRAPDDVMAAGGIRNAWAATGRGHFAIREIDYAEVLRERAGTDGAAWDRIVAYCLQRDSASLDERALALLLEAASDPTRFGELLDKIQGAFADGGVSTGARAAALLQLLQTVVEAADARGPSMAAQVLQTIAASSARLTPEMMLALLAQRESPDAAKASVASAVVERINDTTVASFVANSVIAERGATERLAHAFEALVPEAERKDRLLELAESEARRSESGQQPGFDELWRGAAEMLTSYSDKKYVSDEYARELSSARTQAIEVERVSDDPPERVQQWVASVSDTALRELDLSLLLDLLRVEDHPDEWAQVAGIVAVEIERRTLMGDVAGGLRLAEGIVRERAAEGRPQLASAAAHAADNLAAGPLVRHVVQQLKKADDATTPLLARLCHTIGPGVVPPLAEALAVEGHHRAIRALREILLDFGAAGRQSVEQLKTSSNPAVRRTAIDLLRVFGGHEALPELASMLGDADPQVQREAIRAIVQIGTEDAYAVLERALLAGRAARETLVQQLIGLREDKAAPLLCYVLNHTQPRGRLAKAHADIIDALGALKAHPESTRTLKTVLHRGTWWAPFTIAALREAAAAALARIGSPDAAAVLEEAARTGSRRVRRIARAKAVTAGRRDRERA